MHSPPPQLWRDSAWTLLPALVQLAVVLFGLPWLLLRTGPEQISFLLLMLTVVSASSFMEPVLVRQASMRSASMSHSPVMPRRWCRPEQGMRSAWLMALLVWPATVLFLQARLVPSGAWIEHVIAAALLALQIPLVHLGAGWRGELEGTGRFRGVGMARAGLGVGLLMLPALAAWMGGQALHMVLALLGVRVLYMAALWQGLRRSAGAAAGLSACIASSPCAKDSSPVSASTPTTAAACPPPVARPITRDDEPVWLAMGLAGLLVSLLDRLVATHMLDGLALALYLMAFEWGNRALAMPVAVAAAATPHYSRQAGTRPLWHAPLAARLAMLVGVPGLVLAGGLMLVPHFERTLLSGLPPSSDAADLQQPGRTGVSGALSGIDGIDGIDGAAQVHSARALPSGQPLLWLIVLAFVPGWAVNAAAQFNFVRLQVMGRHIPLVRLWLWQAPVYLLLLVLLAWQWGAAGLALGWTLRVCADAVLQRRLLQDHLVRRLHGMA